LRFGEKIKILLKYIIIINLTPQRTSGPRPSGQAVPLSIYLGTVGASIV